MSKDLTIDDLVDRRIEYRLNQLQIKEFPELITVKEAAEFLGVSESLIHSNLVKNREQNGFPAVRLGTVVKINKAELLHWIKAGGCPLEVEE